MKRPKKVKGVFVNDSGNLGVSFYYNGERRREIYYPGGNPLQDNAANRAAASKFRLQVISAIQAAATGGQQFDYSAFFPESKYPYRNVAGDKGELIKSRLDRWHGSIKKYAKNTTSRVYYSAVRGLTDEFGELTCKQFVADFGKFQRWITKIIQDDKIKTLKALNNRLIPMRAVIGEALLAGEIASNPMLLIKEIPIVKTMKASRKTSRKKETIDPFDISERDRILAAAPAGQVRNLIILGFYAGLRISELFGLAWEDIDFVNGSVTIRVVMTEGEYSETKSDAGERTILLDYVALEALKDQRQYTEMQESVETPAGPRHIVFHNPNTNSPWTHDAYLRERQWKTILKRAKVRYRYPYQMRHTFISMQCMKNVPLKILAQYVGHEDETMIIRNYGKVLEEAARLAGHSMRPDSSGKVVSDLCPNGRVSGLMGT